MIHDGHAPELVDGPDALEPFDGYHVPAHGGAPREAVDELGGLAYGTAVPIRTEGQDLSGGHQGVHFTAIVSNSATPGINPVVQLLGRDYSRLEARILAIDAPIVIAESKEKAEFNAQLAAVSALSPNSITGNGGPQTAPAAFTTISSILSGLLPAATYQVSVTMSLAGTPAQGTDNNNVKLVAGTFSATFPNTIALGVQQTFGPFTLALNGSTSLILQNIAAGTAGAIYQAEIVATPIVPALVAGPQSPSGALIPVGLDRLLRHCDEVWIAATGSGLCRVSVVVARRLGVEPPTLTRA